MAAWESSYNQFFNGEHPAIIAMNPENGRPIQVATVQNHIMSALLSGKPVNLKKLAEFGDCIPPNQSEWEQLYTIEKNLIQV